ncbi:SIMPL domain-containing protein [Undibacterium sp. SXout7W]|uniref:SIMPL domain-containing protein n=1 Tax=Undibacterium sp. SXout7W TaxID=3413049 RepID=UPI003BF3BFD8
MQIIFSTLVMVTLPVYSQNVSGALVNIAGHANINVDNDLAIASFFIEEQDKDKSVAASRVNQKMKQGVDSIKKEDAQAQLATRGYYSYPVYSEEGGSAASRKRPVIGWRIGQYLDVKTQNLTQLPSLVAIAQKNLALHSINFGLSDKSLAKMEQLRLELSYKNLLERIELLAKTMGRRPSDAIIENLSVDQDGSPAMPFQADSMSLKSAMRAEANATEPSFEPGTTKIQSRMVANVRIK